MNIGIFGQHPDNKFGFNSAMSMTWVMSLAPRGHKVTLYIREDSLKVSVRELNFWGLDFEVVSIKVGEKFSPVHDVLIWQSYHAEDHRDYWAAFSSSHSIKVKNFPRFFTGNHIVDKKRLNSSLDAFDLLFFSLEEDKEIASLISSDVSRVHYVPRGFPAKYLSPNFSNDGFLVSVDVRKAARPEGEDYQVFIEAREHLGERGKTIKFQALGASLPGFERVRRCSTLRFYETFLNPAHVYAFVDRNKSYRDKHDLVGGLTSYCGVYENSIVEANMSGSLVIGPDDFVAAELIQNGYSGVRLKDDSCKRQMAEALLYCLESHSELHRNVRARAIASNSLHAMARKFEAALAV